MNEYTNYNRQVQFSVLSPFAQYLLIYTAPLADVDWLMQWTETITGSNPGTGYIIEII